MSCYSRIYKLFGNEFICRNAFLFIIALILFAKVSQARFQHIAYPSIKNFTTRDYNGQPVNFSCIEDDRGFMYFGNLWGILQFDGATWRNIYFPNGSSGVSFAKDDAGIIYCGGRGEFGYLAPDNNGFLRYVSLIHLINGDVNFSDIWSTIYVDSSVVFCSNEAIFIYRNNEIIIIEPETVFERAFKAHDKLFVRERNRGLCYLKNDTLELIPGGEYFADIPVSMILPYNDSVMLIANYYASYLYSNHKVEKWNIGGGNTLLYDSRPSTAIHLNDSTFIFASQTKGLIITDNKGNVLNIFNRNNGLVSNDILSLYPDSYGNIWVMTRGGISKIELNTCFRYINSFHGISGTTYAASIFDNKLFLGTSEGLFSKKISNVQSLDKSFSLVPEIAEGIVWSIQIYGDELFCAHNDGVYVIGKNKTYHVPGTFGAWQIIKPRGTNNILFAGSYQGIMILEKKDQTWRLRSYLKGFNESSRFLVHDAMEKLWVSHGNKGLFKLSLNHRLDSVLRIKNYGIPDGFSSSHNHVVYEFNESVIVSDYDGFYRYDSEKDRFELWKDFNNALGDFTAIQRFVAESDSTFWVILNNEKIVHIVKGSNDIYFSDITIRKFHRQLAGSFEYIFPIDNNATLFATQDGIAIFDKEKYRSIILRDKNRFRAFIRQTELTRDSVMILNAGEIHDFGKTQQLIPKIRFNQNSIRFSFSSNGFEDNEMKQYQYFLEGFDNSWSEWSMSVQKEYTNLPPGKYKYRIRAKNSYDIVSQEDYMEFVILPPWYRSKVAYILYILLCLLMLWGAYKYIIYRFRMQRRRLELKKKRELWSLSRKHIEEQVQKENEILKLSNDKLLAELANFEQQELLRIKDQQIKDELDKSKHDQIQHEQEKHLLEISHKNRELTILAMQIAHKSELISKIREYLIETNKNNDSPVLHHWTEQLFQYIDQDNEHDKEWKEFQEYFEIVHTSFLNKLKSNYPNISPTLLRLSTYLRVKMSNKQIARLMNTTVETVLKNRYRLREKLQLKTEENLDEFIENF